MSSLVRMDLTHQTSTNLSLELIQQYIITRRNTTVINLKTRLQNEILQLNLVKKRRENSFNID